jgi:phage baseplate assembly protein W
VSGNPAGDWLFKGAELGGAIDAPMRAEGIVLTPAGGIAMVSGDEAIRQSIVILLTTLPGERVMRPDYGCPLHRLLFMPNDATTAGLAIHYVRQALVRFEPRVDVVSLDAIAGSLARGLRQQAKDDNNAADMDEDESQHATKLIVLLTYKVRATNRIASLDFEIDLEGAT